MTDPSQKKTDWRFIHFVVPLAITFIPLMWMLLSFYSCSNIYILYAAGFSIFFHCLLIFAGFLFLWILSLLLNWIHSLSNSLLLATKSTRNAEVTKLGLMLFLPEDIALEVLKLRERLLLTRKSIWYVRIKITYEFIRLIWAIHVQIRIDNLRWPSKQRNVDD